MSQYNTKVLKMYYQAQKYSIHYSCFRTAVYNSYRNPFLLSSLVCLLLVIQIYIEELHRLRFMACTCTHYKCSLYGRIIKVRDFLPKSIKNTNVFREILTLSREFKTVIQLNDLLTARLVQIQYTRYIYWLSYCCPDMCLDSSEYCTTA